MITRTSLSCSSSFFSSPFFSSPFSSAFAFSSWAFPFARHFLTSFSFSELAKAIVRLSGDHSGPPAPSGRSVSATASPPLVERR